MQEVALRIAAEYVEEVLDRLLPRLPGGVHQVDSGEYVELRVRNAAVAPETIRRLAGPVVTEIAVRAVSDDWRVRRREDAPAVVIGQRLAIRPRWGVPHPGLPEVVLDAEGTFGQGRHPTTRACLTMLVALEPAGPLLDIGCGSGVIALSAARLGWAPVRAVDLDPCCVAATRRGASLNRLSVDTEELDAAKAIAWPPATVFANVPVGVHLELQRAIRRRPQRLVISGLLVDEYENVRSGYEGLGLRAGWLTIEEGWVTTLLEQTGLTGGRAALPAHGW